MTIFITDIDTYFDLNLSVNQWNSIDIPLSSFSAVVDLTQVDEIKIVGTGNVTLDNLYFGGVSENNNGGSGNGGDDYTGGGTVPTEEISVANGILVGGVNSSNPGFTVYLFDNDSDSVSTCYGGCASAWPPVYVEDNSASGVSNLGSITRNDGTQQVTYNGMPLYFYAGEYSFRLDALDSEMNINWFALTQTNDPVDTPPVDNNDSSNWQAVDSTKWFHQTKLPNGWGWFNNEQQHYTDDLANSYVSDGTLKVVAKKESYTDQGVTKQYTSARLNSKFAFKYGKVEFRAKMPSGFGTWPAVWMLNRNINETGNYWGSLGYASTSWPHCGEIDILEHWGRDPGYAQSAMHNGHSSGATEHHGGRYINNIFSEFHTYSMDWNANEIIFKIDGIEHYRYNPYFYPGFKNSDSWPYDDHFYLILNVAIEESITSGFTQSQMEIDWIRVYHHETNELMWSDEFDSQPQDSDNDGVIDDEDDFPNDPSETIDTDNDGIGNNADTDDDGDGVADTHDAFPLDNTESLDTDQDGIGNNTDNDDDNDGILDAYDALPLDATETLDTDLDGIGNNADTDDDGDGVVDAQDAFPLDSSESLDTDNDGIGNNADTDDDGDGISDVDDTEPLNPNNYDNYQVVSISNTPNAARGRTITLDISYDVTSNENQLTGLGLRLHYDSSKLELIGVNNLLVTDNIINGASSQDDDNDYDANPSEPQ